MSETEIRVIITKSAQTALALQKEDGTFPAGHNGPWKNIDTPVRVTSHWAILLSKAFELTGNTRYKKAAEKACSYLTTKMARPKNYSFYCCKSANEYIRCNGLIGQVWAIEALVEASEILKNKDYLNVAEDVLLKHPFNEQLSIWHCLGIDGKKLDEHSTLNQQVWFLVMSHKVARITNNKKLMKRNEKFLEKLPVLIKFNGDFIEMKINENIFMKSALKFIKLKIDSMWNRRELYVMGQGYLSFTLCGLACLYEMDHNSSLWNNSRLKDIAYKSISYLDKFVFGSSLNLNKYAFQYNPVGFEVAFVKETFKNYVPYPLISTEDWILRQIDDHYDFNKNAMCKNTDDVNTFSSRIYEITRLKNRLL